MNNFTIVFRNTLFLTLSEVFLKIIGFLWIVFLARSLSVELFGRYSFVNSFIAIFSFLPDLGVGLIVIREIAKKRNEASLYLGNSLILNGVLSIVTVLLILSAVFVLNYSSEVALLIGVASLTLFVSTLRSVGIFYFDGMERMNVSAVLNSTNSVLLIGGGLIGFLLAHTLQAVFIGMLVGTMISLMITWARVIIYTFPKFSFDKALVKHLLFEGLPLGLASFAFMVYTRVDSVLLASLMGERSVGIYNSATPFVFSIIQLLNVPFVVALYPALSRLSTIGKDRFVSATKKSLLVIALWSFPAAIIILFFASIIPLIFGEKYQEAVPVLKVLIFFVPFASLSALLYKVLIVIGKQKIYLFVSLIGALFNVVLNLLLIPKYGLMGAAMSSVATQIALFLIYVVTVSKYIARIK